MKMTRLRIPIAVIAVMVLLVFSSMAFAAHMNVPLRDASGNLITNGTTPYSPKQTCTGCHIGADKNAWLTSQSRSGGVLNAADYESGTGTVNKSMYVKNGAGAWVLQAFDVAVPLHGVSVGKHSTEGRNESLVDAQRDAWGAPKTISSPGMSGRF
ncbi:MAG: hypothetical protein WAV13_02195 [Thermodesulfovibrionales bacterium]